MQERSKKKIFKQTNIFRNFVNKRVAALARSRTRHHLIRTRTRSNYARARAFNNVAYPLFGHVFHSRIPQSYNIFATRCKCTHRKAASLFSSRTRQICKNRKSIVAVAKSLNSNAMTQQEKFVRLDKMIKQLDKIYDRMEKIKFACLRENPDGVDTDKLYQAEYDLINAMQELRCARQVNEPF